MAHKSTSVPMFRQMSLSIMHRDHRRKEPSNTCMPLCRGVNMPVSGSLSRDVEPSSAVVLEAPQAFIFRIILGPPLQLSHQTSADLTFNQASHLFVSYHAQQSSQLLRKIGRGFCEPFERLSGPQTMYGILLMLLVHGHSKSKGGQIKLSKVKVYWKERSRLELVESISICEVF
ncbi:hypothetical protein DL98DRAFT_111718 [Cadophora sp. DSE1049]|nr:hypothetical protein DL98DRAFT_111718 [Cadophora sp. DSE1049]